MDDQIWLEGASFEEKVLATLSSLNQKTNGMEDNLAKLVAHVNKQNGRIGKLEAFKNRALGAVALIVVVAGLLIRWLK